MDLYRRSTARWEGREVGGSRGDVLSLAGGSVVAKN